MALFKETSVAYFFDVAGLLAGFIVAFQLGVFRLTPWAIALYPAIISAKVISGLLSGRLSTALHLGTINPKFSGNTKSFYKLIEAVIVLTLVMSLGISIFSLLFGHLFWGVTLADFSAILPVMLATMATSLLINVLTVKIAFVTFTRGLDPDIIVYPIMSTVAGILITVCYIGVLNVYFFGYMGKLVIVFIALIHVLLVLYILPKNRREIEFIRTLKESFFMMLFVALMVNITGTFFKGISNFAQDRKEIYTVYPALINMVSDVGSVVGSTANTKLALGLLTPSFSSIGKHAKNIFSAWASSIIMFILLAVISLGINGVFSLSTFSSFILVLLVANLIAVSAIVIISYSVSILTFKRGLDPDNFVIPVESSFAYSVSSIALLVALLLIAFITGA